MKHSHDRHTREILVRIAEGRQVSQRSLSQELGIALGLTNLLVRRVVKKGWVKVVNMKPNRVRYLITPSGIAETARATRAYFESTIRLYTETRERIRKNLLAIADRAGNVRPVKVVFYGAGEVGELAYVSLQGSHLQLVGVVDDDGGGTFFGMPVHSASALQPMMLDGHPFDVLIVMSLRQAEDIRTQLETSGFPLDRVFWLV